MKAPSRNEALAATADGQRGAQLFDSVGCATCHVSEIVTAPAGTVLNGGAFIVPESLDDKILHPYSDFLLHNVETGDGIQQNGGRSTAGKMRTAPLWGLRTRARFLHDGTTMTLMEAILRHRGEAGSVTKAFLSLPQRERERIITFLESL